MTVLQKDKSDPAEPSEVYLPTERWILVAFVKSKWTNFSLLKKPGGNEKM